MKFPLFKLSAILLLMCIVFGCDQSNYDGYIYIVSRNSKSKEGDLVLKYNSTKNNISHIGIALNKSKNSFIYHISYDKINSMNSSLLKENYSDFWSSPDKKDNRIWALPVSLEEFQEIKDHINTLQKETIYFDLNPNTKLGLYCSEFVYNVLIKVSNRFTVNPIHKRLRRYERLIVGEDNLTYYPADFFIGYKNINEL